MKITRQIVEEKIAGYVLGSLHVSRARDCVARNRKPLGAAGSDRFDDLTI